VLAREPLPVGSLAHPAEHLRGHHEFVAAHPAVESDAGRVAVERGPLVYCAEAVDNDRPRHQYALPADAEYREDLLGGVTTVETDASVPSLDGWADELYRPVDETDAVDPLAALVPYYAWDNRDPGEMSVWLRFESRYTVVHE